MAAPGNSMSNLWGAIPAAKDAGSNALSYLWKQSMPSDARVFLNTLAGDRSPITEKDFRPDELAEMRGLIEDKTRKFKEREKNLGAYQQEFNNFSPVNFALTVAKDPEWRELSQLFAYQDKITPAQETRRNELHSRVFSRYEKQVPSLKMLYYALGETPANVMKITQEYKNNIVNSENQKDIQSAADLAHQYATKGGNIQYEDMNYSAPPRAMTTLGRFNFSRKPDNAVEITDRYDFSNETRDSAVENYKSMTPLNRMMSVMSDIARTKAYTNPRDLASILGNAYIGADGRPVNIRIPAKK